MAGFTAQQLTFIMEKTIETKSPKKNTKSFSEEIQMWYTFKKIYSSEIQELLRNSKRPHKQESWAISYGSNELQYWKSKG